MALLVVLLAMAMLMALGSALVLTTTVETRIVAHHRASTEALHAAGAALTRALVDLDLAADWGPLPSGAVPSTFTDGPPAGVRPLPEGGGSADLTALTHLVRCGRHTPCDPADLWRVSADRPWGRNNPQWELYAYGPLARLLPPDAPGSPLYVIVWIADDPAETDDDPFVDGGPPTDDPAGANPGRGVLSLLAHAYGPGGTRRVIEAIVRRGAAGVTLDSWSDGAR